MAVLKIINYSKAYTGVARGTHQYIQNPRHNNVKNPAFNRIISKQCAFLVALENLTRQEVYNHPEYIPPTMWRLLEREWKRDE